MKRCNCLIAALLLISLFAAPYVSAEEPELESTAEYQKLAAFGIMKAEDDIVYYDTITRGLFLTYIIRCCDDIPKIIDVSQEESPFTDVTWAGEDRDAIVLAEQLGIIDRAENGLFRPDDNITQPEMAKIVMNLLGYDEVCRMAGGFPMGYVSKAAEHGLFNGCAFTPEGYITKNGLAKLLMNMLESDMLYVKSIWYSNSKITRGYRKAEDKNYLNYVYDIYKTIGVVSSNEYTSINGTAEVSAGQVMIDGQIYDVAQTKAAELVGYSTECYYRYHADSGDREILYAQPYRKNRMITVDSEDVAASSVTAGKFCYYQDGRSKSEQIPKSATLIYNGGQMKISAEALCPELGTVTLIDNDSDGQIDVIRVMNYRTIQVSGIAKSSHTITDKLGGEAIELDPKNIDYDVILEKDGQPATFESIEVDDIISYAASSGNKKDVKYGIISSKTVTGTLAAVAEDSVTIGETEYPVDKTLQGSLSAGEEGEFYLDFKGRIVAKKSTVDVVYGYLNDLYMDNFGSVQAQIFTENDHWVILNLNEKIKFNGAGGYPCKSFYLYCTEELEDYRQLVTYTVSDERKINRIDFAQSFAEYSDEEERAIDENIFRLSHAESMANYRSGMKSFDNAIMLKDDTRIFMVPNQEKGVKADLDDFYIIKPATLEADKKYYNISGYDMDRSRYAKVCLLMGNTISIDKMGSIMIVDSIGKGVGTDGAEVDVIAGMYKGAMVKVYTKDKELLKAFPTLDKGDVIQFSLDASGSVCRIDLCYDYTKGTLPSEILTGNLYGRGTFIGGEVYYADYQNQRLLLNSGSGKAVLYTNAGTKVYIYDMQTEEFSSGEFSDIEKGGYVFVKTNYYRADEIVIYR